MAEMTTYQQYIHQSRYARWLPEKGRRETWPETVSRYCEFFANRFPDLADEIRGEIRESIERMDTMPSMRSLMTAGPALELENMAGYNCSYISVDSKRAFSEALYVLMCGTGVGFSCERQEIKKLPEIASEMRDCDDLIVVEDSRIGWAKAYQRLISHLYAGGIPKTDFSRIRPKGAPLKTFGGRASGPEPLERLFANTTRMFRNAAGRRFTSLEVHDLMCYIGEIVTVGGVRRSAMISLSNLSDARIRDAKSGQWWTTDPQRALANNSAVYTDRPEAEIFMEEWLALVKSKSGERGIFNREAAAKKFREIGRKEVEHIGTNPCVPGDTLILTTSGYYPIADLVGRETTVWNGWEWSDVVPFPTGHNPLVRVTLSNGTSLDCTPYHKWILADGRRVEARDLESDDRLIKAQMPVVASGAEYGVDAYSQGFYSGDGTAGWEWSWVYDTKRECIDRLQGRVVSTSRNRSKWHHGPMFEKSWVPMEGSLRYRLDWLAGLLDSDGNVTRNPNSTALAITSKNNEFLQRVRLMLTTVGVQAHIGSLKPAGVYDMPDGHGGLKAVYCEQTWRLLINVVDTARLVSMGLVTSRLKIEKTDPDFSKARHVTVVSVENLDEVVETFCYTDPLNNSGTFNGIVTANCGEILLRSRQLCNLTEVVVREGDDEASLMEKVRIATILGTLQASLTDFKFVSEAWEKNTREEALLGVSMTGTMDNPLTSGQNGEMHLSGVLLRLREYARAVNREYAERIGINPAAAITCVKPSGTVSQLVQSGSGIHTRYAKHFLRTVRVDKKDPIYRFMVDKGVYHEDEVHRPDVGAVFYFPTRAPEHSITRNERDAIEQLRLWSIYQRYWCDHNPSVTIDVRDYEWPAVGAWVFDNFHLVCGVSFLPYSDHIYEQAPYQEITEEQYCDWVAKHPLPKIDWTELGRYESGDNTVSSQTMACVGGVCEIADSPVID